jgi:hypothetical protein
MLQKRELKITLVSEQKLIRQEGERYYNPSRGGTGRQKSSLIDGSGRHSANSLHQPSDRRGGRESRPQAASTATG